MLLFSERIELWIENTVGPSLLTPFSPSLDYFFWKLLKIVSTFLWPCNNRHTNLLFVYKSSTKNGYAYLFKKIKILLYAVYRIDRILESDKASTKSTSLS
jgi:hypothetical protein